MRWVPTMKGTIERRLLVNYRVDPEVVTRLLPEPFMPHIVGGSAVAGICLIRLGHLRPIGVPAALGVTSENAAHRVAIQWREPDGMHRGVYIPRRDTSSRLTTLVGGRLFPGDHHRARFHVQEDSGRYDVAFASLDGTARAAVSGRAAVELPAGSIFSSLSEASAFFRDSPLGYSSTRDPRTCDGLELRCATWEVEALTVEHAESSFFDDEQLFPVGSVELDSALVMRAVPATWHAMGALATGDRSILATPSSTPTPNG
jgi:uncharacterized protein YqjF (DUF2071 family)